MASLKPREIDRFISAPEFSRPVILLYGPDAGLVSERADRIAEKSGVDLADPFALFRMDADDAASDSARIADEAHTIGMFGGKRLIRISGTTRRDLLKAIKPVLETPPEDSIILIEAGELAKSAALRKNLEKHPAALCIPCYQDNDAAIDQLIDEELVQHGLTVDRETRQSLKAMLGENRMISRGELAKLALYCHGTDKVTMAAVEEIVGDASRLVIDDVVDAAATGQIARLQKILPKALQSGNRPDMILAATLRHFQMLQGARAKIEKHRQNPGAVIVGLRPPVHFSRKDKIIAALSIWPGSRIGRALTRIDKAMLDARANDSAGGALAGTALLAIAMEAERLKSFK